MYLINEISKRRSIENKQLYRNGQPNGRSGNLMTTSTAETPLEEGSRKREALKIQNNT